MQPISWSDFEKVDLRAGTILRAEDFPRARKPSYQLWIDLGPELGVKCSSAQLTRLYTKEELVGRQVLCVVNFPPRQIANFFSEVLTTGFVLPDGEVILTQPDRPVPNGTRLA
jgi:tRNA-binding protein